MARVYISIGSNVDAKENIQAAIAALENQFGRLTQSKIYENKAVGFDGDDFLNLVVGLDTRLAILDFVAALHQIEAAQGRTREAAKFSPRSLDMDLLLYDNEIFESTTVNIPRDEITRYAFVLQPLFELVPDYSHPTLSKTIAQLWMEFDKTELQMKAVSLKA